MTTNLVAGRVTTAVTFDWFVGATAQSTGIRMLWIIPLGASLTWVIVLSALPVTRRLAQLRAAHLIRALLGSAVGIAVGFGIGRIAIAGDVVGAKAEGALLLALGLTTLWVLLWWLAALRRGWAIDSRSLAVTGTIAAFLGGVTLLAHVVLI